MKPYQLRGLIFLFVTIFYNAVTAQHSPTSLQEWSTDTANKYFPLKEVIVSAIKFGGNKTRIVHQVDVVSANYIRQVNTQNTGDLLNNTGKVFTQKSQLGGGSAVIRGFEASRILLIVDGVRMNNAIYRTGHLQNLITVDQNMLEKVEIIHGPFSTLYGSDAMGGSIYMETKSVALATPGKKNISSASAFVRYSSANNERTGHADLNLGFRKIGFLSSITLSDFDDMRMGSQYPANYPEFGKRIEYVASSKVPLTDTIVSNNNAEIQRNSGYRQLDILQKILFRQSENVAHQLNLQISNSSNVPRYDRLQDKRNGVLRYAEWYYGPQKRNFYAYNFSAKDLHGLFDEIRSSISYQDIRESRQTREFRRYDRFDSRREHIKVWGAAIDGKISNGRHEVTIGTDAQWNDVVSKADRTNLLTLEKTKLDSRYPNGKNRMNNYAIYAQHAYTMLQDKLVLNDGIRLQAVNLSSTIADNSFFNLPVTQMSQRSLALTGNLGLVYLPSGNTKISLGMSTGFRAPNIDDLARIFESSSSLRRVVVPNPAIKPEYTYSFDAGVNYVISRIIKVEAAAFYTMFRNAIALAPFNLAGNDSIQYNGALCQVVANQNINKAFVYGFNGTISGIINKHFSITSTMNYTYGRYKMDNKVPTAIYQKQMNGSYELINANVRHKPLDHIPPLFGKTSFQYTSKVWSTEFFLHYNGWKRLENYNADGEDNAEYATNDGAPAWATINVRTTYTINNNVQCQAAIENIMDKNYRSFASGISAPGRNFVVAIRSSL